jgi:hypothetical protein
VSRVGADDGLFALGGDSIMAIKLVSLAGAAGLGFTVQDVFEKQSAAELARAARAVPETPVEARPPNRPLISLSPEQLERLAQEIKRR